MPYEDDNPAPLYILEGDLLKPMEVSGNRYAFEHMTFKETPVQVASSDFDTSNIAQWKKNFPKELNSAIFFKNMMDMKNLILNRKDDTTASVLDDDGTERISATMNRPCGFITATYSIMPQLLILEGLSENHAFAAKESYFQWSFTRELWRISTGTTDNALSSREQTQREREKNGEGKYSRVATCLKKPRFDAFALTISIKKDGLKDDTEADILLKFNGSDAQNNPTDSMVVKYSSKSDVTMVINSNENSATGPLTFAEEGLKTTVMQNCEFKEDKDAHVVFVYPTLNRVVVTGDLVTDTTQVSKAVSCIKKAKANLQEATKPTLEEFPVQHKTGNADYIYVNDSSLYFRVPDSLSVEVRNCEAAFSITPLRFCPTLEFTYAYRIAGKREDINIESSTKKYKDYNYFILEVGGGLSQYTGYNNKFYSKFAYYDSDTDSSVFYVEFRIYGKNHSSRYCAQVRPLEILGMVHVTRRSGNLADIRAGDGSFANGFKANLTSQRLYAYMSGSSEPIGRNWTDYITSISISHSESGTSGSVTLDRHMMMPNLSKLLTQSIGATTLLARNGYYDLNPSLKNFTSSIYSETPGLVFRGYAVKEDMGNANDNADITVNLMGIQKKLSDMKHVNCPYWDGDQVFENGSDGVLNYLISYIYDSRLSNGTHAGDSTLGGAARNYILPRSINLNAPAVHFAMGTPVLDSIKEIARMINHMFLVQPDGRGYFYGLNGYGIPAWIYNGPVRKIYREAEIISLSLEPYLENRYNTFLTVALKGKPDPNSGQIVPDGVMIQSKLDEKPKNDSTEYPWSRIITNRGNGVLTREQFLKLHRRNVQFGSMMYFLGSMTVPGYHGFYLLDKRGIQDSVGYTTYFFITQINHSLNLAQKEWTTILSITNLS